MPILEGEKVTKYFGGLAAVSNVDFAVEEGEVLGLIGPNGAGKTTLFNLISGALVPKPGVIRFKGENIARSSWMLKVLNYITTPIFFRTSPFFRLGPKPYKICRSGVARTFQTVKVFANMPVLQNVLLGSLFGASPGMSSADAAREATELLDFVGLSAVSMTPARDLTLANQKRLEVARALATKPELLMLDELMAGLNATEIAEGMELVKRIREKGITIIMVEHVMKAIMGVCDRIMVLHHGEKIAEGTPQEIVTSKKVIEVYLGEQADAGS